MLDDRPWQNNRYKTTGNFTFGNGVAYFATYARTLCVSRSLACSQNHTAFNVMLFIFIYFFSIFYTIVTRHCAHTVTLKRLELYVRAFCFTIEFICFRLFFFFSFHMSFDSLFLSIFLSFSWIGLFVARCQFGFENLVSFRRNVGEKEN